MSEFRNRNAYQDNDDEMNPHSSSSLKSAPLSNQNQDAEAVEIMDDEDDDDSSSSSSSSMDRGADERSRSSSSSDKSDLKLKEEETVDKINEFKNSTKNNVLEADFGNLNPASSIHKQLNQNIENSALGGGLDELEESDDRKRFQIELEFVQSLANPNYLNFLAQRGYFRNQTFLNYLKYLMYWKEPQYCKYLIYPQCLALLELLQHEQFLKEIVNAQCSKYVDEQLLLIWLHYKKKHDWKRIDPTKIPDNIEKLFLADKTSHTNNNNNNDASNDNDNNNNNSNSNNKNSNMHYGDNSLLPGQNDDEKNEPFEDIFSASRYIKNEKF